MRLKPLALATLSVLAASPALAAVISFPNTACASAADGVGGFVACTGGSFINQAHGDVAGLLDVSYRDAKSAAGDSLRWWGAGYSNLPSALWATGGDTNSLGRITLTPAAGQRITLDSLDLGAFSSPNRGTQLRVTALDGATYTFSGNIGTPSGTATGFSPAVSSLTGIVIEWENSAYNVGLSNIGYTLAPVPEPGSYALMLAGLAALGLIARRLPR